LTWRRSLRSERWGDEKAPKLILITNFVEQEISDTQTVTTKLLGIICAFLLGWHKTWAFNESSKSSENRQDVEKRTMLCEDAQCLSVI
uniref:Secreted protein n=1 Tax=Gongylonema pulchrum TaxID=637853 RepID=A0A183DDW8_9BILA